MFLLLVLKTVSKNLIVITGAATDSWTDSAGSLIKSPDLQASMQHAPLGRPMISVADKEGRNGNSSEEGALPTTQTSRGGPSRIGHRYGSEEARTSDGGGVGC